MSRGDWASWMQAVGSVLAVAAAIGVVGWDIQHRRIARAIEEVQRLQMIWTFAYHCRVEMQYAKESAHLPSPEAFHVPNGLRQKVAALRHVPTLELLEPAVAAAVLTVIEAYEVFDLAIPQVPGVSRPQSSDYIRAQANTAFKNFDFAERELRGVLKRARIRARLARVQAGNFGDFKPLQDGVQELRIDHGPGYRVYLSRQGPVVVLLLCGSDKPGQAAAIKQAVAYLNDWRKRGEP